MPSRPPSRPPPPPDGGRDPRRTPGPPRRGTARSPRRRRRPVPPTRARRDQVGDGVRSEDREPSGEALENDAGQELDAARMHEEVRGGEGLLEPVLGHFPEELYAITGRPDHPGVVDVRDRAGDPQREPGPSQRPGRDLPPLERGHDPDPEGDRPISPVPAGVEPVRVHADGDHAHPTTRGRADPACDRRPQPLGQGDGVGRAPYGPTLQAVPPLAPPVRPVEPVAGVAGVHVWEAGPSEPVRDHRGACVENVVRDPAKQFGETHSEPVFVGPSFPPDLVHDGDLVSHGSQRLCELGEGALDAPVAGRRDGVDPGAREHDAHPRRTYVLSKRVPTVLRNRYTEPAGCVGMAYWLVKQEPTSYSYDRLVRDGATEWDGVHNALALRHLRAMRPGDEALYYHSGEERRAVGILRITGEPHPDPADPRGSWSVRVAPVRRLPRPVTLAELRTTPGLDGLALLRISRLSVMPVDGAHWTIILGRSETPTPAVTRAGRSANRARAARRGASKVARRPKRSSASGAARRGTGRRRGRGTGG